MIIWPKVELIATIMIFDHIWIALVYLGNSEHICFLEQEVKLLFEIIRIQVKALVTVFKPKIVSTFLNQHEPHSYPFINSACLYIH